MVAPNGKLSIEDARLQKYDGHYHSQKARARGKRVCELSELVSKLRDIEPELVSGELTTKLLVLEQDFVGLYNHLVATQLMAPKEAYDYVARQYDTLAREKGIPTLAESDGYAERSLYTVAAAAVSWGGVEKYSIPYAEPSVGYAVGIDKVLSRLHSGAIIITQVGGIGFLSTSRRKARWFVMTCSRTR